MHDVFISYSSTDKQVADAIVHYLEAQKIRCWIAPRDIIPGQSYPEAIANAIDNCKVFVLIFTQNSNSSRQVESEMTLALSAEKTILPFKLDDTQPTKSFKYIFGASHWLDAMNKNIENSIKVLGESIYKLLDLKPTKEQDKNITVEPIAKPSSNTFDSAKIVTFQELMLLGYDSLAVAKRLEENDLENYKGMTLEQEGDCEQWAEYLDDYPETFRFLINDNNEIVGSWYILAATEEQYIKIMRGEWNEIDFKIDNTEYLAVDGIYKGFILDMSINKKYRNIDNNRQLIESFFSQIENYALNGIFFSDWVVNVFSRNSLPLFRSMGFEKVCDHKTFGEIYHLSLLPLPNILLLNRFTKMKELYQKL